jgi:hypothetical protein
MKKLQNFNCSSVYTLIILWVGVLLSLNCSNPKHPGSYNANNHPKTRLANVPSPNDTSNSPTLTLYWVGDDPDGFVTGYKYTWSYQVNGIDSVHPYKYILNIIVEKLALMVLSDDDKKIPPLYRYFATLDKETGLNADMRDSLVRGDTISLLGQRIYASNPDSIRIQTGQRIKYSFPVHKNPNTGTFIFDSQDKWNHHLFKVSAIDNLGDTSLVPATLNFTTPQVTAPHTRVTGFPEDTSFALSGVTPTYGGIRFDFQGIDPNSRTIDYRWVVDRDQWLAKTGKIPWSQFTPSEFAYVTASDFPDPYASTHTFYVQSRNEFGSIDTVGYFLKIQRNQNGDSTGVQIDSAWHQFYTIYPPFARPDLPPTEKILFLNNTYYSSRVPISPAHPHWQDVDTYYLDIAHGLGIADSNITLFRAKRFDFPGRGEIGKYKAVIMYSDCVDEFGYYTWGQENEVGGSKEAVLRDYCYVGGNIIFSGWAITAGSNFVRNDEFYSHIFHVDIDPRKISRFPNSDCIGVNSLVSRGYPNLRLDTAKTDTAWHGGLSGILKNYPVGFGETIQKFASLSGNQIYEQVPVSLRYSGITFNVVLFGVPLYYMERPAVDSALAVAFRDIAK